MPSAASLGRSRRANLDNDGDFDNGDYLDDTSDPRGGKGYATWVAPSHLPNDTTVMVGFFR